jgi:hypothetical protein
MPRQAHTIPLMEPERARDIARGLKWLADRYDEADMADEAAATLRDSKWWLSYAGILDSPRCPTGETQ